MLKFEPFFFLLSDCVQPLAAAGKTAIVPQQCIELIFLHFALCDGLEEQDTMW